MEEVWKDIYFYDFRTDEYIIKFKQIEIKGE